MVDATRGHHRAPAARAWFRLPRTDRRRGRCRARGELSPPRRGHALRLPTRRTYRWRPPYRLPFACSVTVYAEAAALAASTAGARASAVAARCCNSCPSTAVCAVRAHAQRGARRRARPATCAHRRRSTMVAWRHADRSAGQRTGMRVIHTKPPDDGRRSTPRSTASRHLPLPNLFDRGLVRRLLRHRRGIGTRFEAAAIAVLVAMVLDGMDGRIARMTNTQSDFGAQYDSLSDMVCSALRRVDLLNGPCSNSARSGGWRLSSTPPPRPCAWPASIPRSAMPTSGSSRAAEPRGCRGGDGAGVVRTSFRVARAGRAAAPRRRHHDQRALLMVSNLRYYSFKDFDLRGRVPFVAVWPS